MQNTFDLERAFAMNFEKKQYKQLHFRNEKIALLNLKVRKMLEDVEDAKHIRP